MSHEIESKIIALIVATLHVDRATIHHDATLAGDLGADSLQLVELILALEVEFQIDIPDEDAAEISTVEQVIEYVIIALAIKERPIAPSVASLSAMSAHPSRKSDARNL